MEKILIEKLISGALNKDRFSELAPDTTMLKIHSDTLETQSSNKAKSQFRIPSTNPINFYSLDQKAVIPIIYPMILNTILRNEGTIQFIAVVIKHIASAFFDSLVFRKYIEDYLYYNYTDTKTMSNNCSQQDLINLISSRVFVLDFSSKVEFDFQMVHFNALCRDTQNGLFPLSTEIPTKIGLVIIDHPNLVYKFFDLNVSNNETFTKLIKKANKNDQIDKQDVSGPELESLRALKSRLLHLRNEHGFYLIFNYHYHKRREHLVKLRKFYLYSNFIQNAKHYVHIRHQDIHFVFNYSIGDFATGDNVFIVEPIEENVSAFIKKRQINICEDAKQNGIVYLKSFSSVLFAGILEGNSEMICFYVYEIDRASN